MAKTRVGILAFVIVFSIGANPAMHAQGGVPAPVPVEGSTQDSANDMVLVVGKSVLVDTAHQITRVAVGSSELAEATAVSPTEVMLNAKLVGETSLIIWQVNGERQFFNVKIRASSAVANDRLESVRRELRTELPGQALKVSAENGQVYLRGTVKNLNSSDRAVQIASVAGKVTNLLYVNVPVAEPQILLKVKFASLDRTVQRQLGINIFSTGATNSIGTVTTQQFSPPNVSTGTPGTPPAATLSSLLNLFIFRPDLNLGATISALQTQGVLQILAEPNLLTSNGKQGSFLAGGEYPYPVIQGTSGSGSGAVTIVFKEFGVRLNFIPTITPRGTIRLQVAPEVSSLDFANGLTISGFTIPALSTRKVKTEVELSEGQSFAIAGLMDNRETKNFSKIPFLGDIPILGKFFQSQTKTRSNTELMVIVTPEIVNPIPVGSPLPEIKYPDAFLPNNSGIPMTNPMGTPTEGRQPAKLPTSIPVEQLIQSMAPEQPLNTNSTSSTSSSSASGSATQAGSGPAGPPNE